MRRRALLGFVLASGLLGCLSPSLPLPPPYEPTVSPSKLGADYVHLKGTGVESSALVSIYNPDAPPSMVGVIAQPDATGNWEADVYAKPGQVLRIWQEVSGQVSQQITIQIK